MLYKINFIGVWNYVKLRKCSRVLSFELTVNKWMQPFKIGRRATVRQKQKVMGVVALHVCRVQSEELLLCTHLG